MDRIMDAMRRNKIEKRWCMAFLLALLFPESHQNSIENKSHSVYTYKQLSHSISTWTSVTHFFLSSRVRRWLYIEKALRFLFIRRHRHQLQSISSSIRLCIQSIGSNLGSKSKSWNSICIVEYYSIHQRNTQSKEVSTDFCYCQLLLLQSTLLLTKERIEKSELKLKRQNKQLKLKRLHKPFRDKTLKNPLTQ